MLARFRFQDGLIVEHIDTFSFYALVASGAWAASAPCWAGLRCCATWCARKAAAGLDEFLGRPVVAPTRGTALSAWAIGRSPPLR